MDTFNYDTRTREHIACNLCGAIDAVVLARRSVNNLKVTTVMCRVCTLVYISPRMSKEDYNQYYLTSAYRQDRAAIKRKEFVNGLDKNFQQARRFGAGIIHYMGRYVRDGLTIDVGSSTGGILYGMREQRPKLEILGIEPSGDEGNYGQSKGVPTKIGLFEDVGVEVSGKATNILCMQSLNHLLDPMGFLKWAYQMLDDEGHIFLAVKNWRHQIRRMGRLTSGIQIDHVYMFTPETLASMCAVAGFEVVYIDIDEGKSPQEIAEQKGHGLSAHHIRIVARKSRVPIRPIFSRRDYYRARLAFFAPWVKIVYLVIYSRRFAFVRKILHI